MKIFYEFGEATAGGVDQGMKEEFGNDEEDTTDCDDIPDFIYEDDGEDNYGDVDGGKEDPIEREKWGCFECAGPYMSGTATNQCGALARELAGTHKCEPNGRKSGERLAAPPLTMAGMPKLPDGELEACDAALGFQADAQSWPKPSELRTFGDQRRTATSDPVWSHDSRTHTSTKASRKRRKKAEGRRRNKVVLDMTTQEWKAMPTKRDTAEEKVNSAKDKQWYDEAEPLALIEDDEEDKKGNELLGSWRTEPEHGWVQVQSVMDSGASAPVCPPSMAPNAPIRPSAGSRRGQQYTSASRHKIPNLGEQLLQAATEAGEETQVLFQVAEVSRPLVSVSAICEQGNRVTFGRGGGVVTNIASGHETPFYRKNGIYVLNMWIHDADTPVFARP